MNGAAVQVVPLGSARAARQARSGEQPRTAVAIGVLGQLRVSRFGKDATPTPPKLRQFLTLLVVSAGEIVRLETITEEMWGAEPTQRNCRTVQTYVSQLRKLLAAAPLAGSRVPPVSIVHTPRVGYSLRLGPGGRTDLDDFRRRVEHLIAEDPADAEPWLGAADRMFRGDPLDDVALGPVLLRQRDRLRDERCAVLEQYFARRLELGDPEPVALLAPRLREEDVRYDALHAQLIRALCATGRQPEAVEHHRQVAERLRERGETPGPELVRLAEELPELVDPVIAVRYQAPALGRPREMPRPAQLPVDPLPFVGFEAELARTAEAMLGRTDDRPAVAVVVGGPGAGKTACCIRLAERIAERYPDGQLYADLWQVSPAEALGGFLVALGAEYVPAGLHERIRLFRRITADRSVLVFADGVSGPEAVSTLLPGSASSGVIVASAVRPAAEPRTVVTELGPLSATQRWQVLEQRVGAERLAVDTEQTALALRSTDGLPLAVNVLAAKALMRPHWTMQRLAERASRREPLVSWKVGSLDLAASVGRTVQLLDPRMQRLSRALLAASPGPAEYTVRAAAERMATSDAVAEDVCEALVELRLADITYPAGGTDTMAYRIPELYRVAAGVHEAELRRA